MAMRPTFRGLKVGEEWGKEFLADLADLFHVEIEDTLPFEVEL